MSSEKIAAAEVHAAENHQMPELKYWEADVQTAKSLKKML